MTSNAISKGFIISGVMNTIGILIFSKFFTNEVIPNSDPVVMSYFGLLMIMVWGCAFIAVAKTFEKVGWLIAIFTVEKLCYVIAFILWHSSHNVIQVYEHDLLAGLFYSFYGLNDFIFMVFFGYVFLKVKPSLKKLPH